MSTPELEKPLLIFSWGHKPRRTGALLFWLIIAAVLIFSFYLFFRLERVLQTTRVRPVHSVLLLDSRLATSQHLMNKAQDQSLIALGTGLSSHLDEEAYKLPKFRPSFQDFELQLKTRPEDEPKLRAFPQIVSSAALLAPPPLTSTPVRATPTASPALVWQIISGLKGRSILQQPALPTEIGAYALEVPFQVEINAAGKVIFALPVETPEDSREVLTQLRHSLESLRFHPSKEGSPPAHGLLRLTPEQPTPAAKQEL
jgi:hypothetical protein